MSYFTGTVVAPPPSAPGYYNGSGGTYGAQGGGGGGGAIYANSNLASSGQILFAEAMAGAYDEAIPVAVPPPSVAPLPVYQSRSPANPLQGQFNRYDELNSMIQSMGDASGARANGERNLEAAQRMYDENDKLLQKNRASQPRAERRLHRNAHPRFLHYFQFDREGKVKRLERELEELRADERRRDELKKQYAAEVEQQRRALANLQAYESQQKQAQREKQQIFDNVVDTQPPTPNLSNLRYQINQAESEKSIEANLLQAVERSLSQIDGARNLFNQAARQLREATGMNVGAGVVNLGQGYRNDRRFGADDMAERMMQMRRDQLLNQARDTALRAADQLQAAFNSFPMEARVRYPQLTATICNAPLPNLRGANYFGTLAVGWAFVS